MANSPIASLQPPSMSPDPRPDAIRMRRWFGLFALYLLGLGVPALWMLSRLEGHWTSLFTDPGAYTQVHHQVLKLLVMMIYLALCSTFVPMPTGWLVAAVATREVALTGELWSTVLLVALAGGLASTVANLHDYHMLTLMLRHRRLAAVRGTGLYHVASRWFARAPFTLQVLSNLVPIPVDAVRVLAITCGYPRRPYVVANFLGRFARYGVLAAMAYALHLSPLTAAGIMLAVAAGLGMLRWIVPATRRILRG